jgi:hypothetical protein
MRIFFLFIALLAFSCKQETSKQKKIYDSITGNWLIVYPDHVLIDGPGRELYTGMQDSIVGLTALKLVSFTEDGIFKQLDSTNKIGQWKLSMDNDLFVYGGGKGFENFRAAFASYGDGTMKIIENVKKRGISIPLVWHLRKIESDHDAADLFSEKRNRWRKKPVSASSEKDLKDRLAAMLEYYADYFRLVDEESSFFISSRVPLPFKFYQHAMWTKPLEESEAFINQFSNLQEAQKAYAILDAALDAQKSNFKRGKNFVDEYAMFMDKLAGHIKD